MFPATMALLLAPPALELHRDYHLEYFVFSRGPGAQEVVYIPDDWGSGVFDFNLLSDEGAILVTTWQGYSYLYSPGTRIWSLVQNSNPFFPFIGSWGKDHTPVYWKIADNGTVHLKAWTGKPGIFRTVFVSPSWNAFASRMVWKCPLNSSAVPKGYAALHGVERSAYSRQIWVAGKSSASVVWREKQHRLEGWRLGQPTWLMQVSSKSKFLAVSGNDLFATVSFVDNANAALFTRSGQRTHWTDAKFTNQPPESYTTYVIRLSDFKLIQTIKGAARVELTRVIST
jgi:hypothetical protein